MEISIAWTTILKIIATGALVYVIVPALLVLRDALLWWVLERSLVNSTLEKAIIDRSNVLRLLKGELSLAETIVGSGDDIEFYLDDKRVSWDEFEKYSSRRDSVINRLQRAEALIVRRKKIIDWFISHYKLTSMSNPIPEIEPSTKEYLKRLSVEQNG
ncbi:MAG: hypothetical protein ACQEW7_00025 [Pseudomonadota bacterium]